ncbi:hypothetical protein OWR29_26120 [Actinoplanes sp. Pm04-4]|uniref:Uncharacterized protein n=1 Tax=Paractinoplanes pyxinae TaxID=2997416 RepID=A0ABT4B4R0_9ACTN|nr:hypothetical protein [Actinoplanes pyxinae]MCY1141488.1 hypothetical protein [Actinoplanes pyxinae]
MVVVAVRSAVVIGELAPVDSEARLGMGLGELVVQVPAGGGWAARGEPARPVARRAATPQLRQHFGRDVGEGR